MRIDFELGHEVEDFAGYWIRIILYIKPYAHQCFGLAAHLFLFLKVPYLYYF